MVFTRIHAALLTLAIALSQGVALAEEASAPAQNTAQTTQQVPATQPTTATSAQTESSPTTQSTQPTPSSPAVTASPTNAPQQAVQSPALPQAVAPNPGITGQVQAIQQAPAALQAALTAADILEIQYQPGESKHKIQEYTITLNNKQAKHLEVLQLEVVNGMTAEAYAQLKHQNAQAKRRLAGGMLRGLTSVATSFVPYAGVGSMAAYHAIGAGTQAVSVAANAIEQSGGAEDYTGRIVQRASNIMLTPQQKFQAMAAVPQPQAPMIKVIFKDLQTNQIYDLHK